MSLYFKLKIAFESLCAIIGVVVWFFVIFYQPCSQKEQNLISFFLPLVCILTCLFSIASIRDKISLKRQSVVQTILGILFIAIVSYSFYTLQTNECRFLLIFSFIFLGLWVVRFFDLAFCSHRYVDEYITLGV